MINCPEYILLVDRQRWIPWIFHWTRKWGNLYSPWPWIKFTVYTFLYGNIGLSSCKKAVLCTIGFKTLSYPEAKNGINNNWPDVASYKWVCMLWRFLMAPIVLLSDKTSYTYIRVFKLAKWNKMELFGAVYCVVSPGMYGMQGEKYKRLNPACIVVSLLKLAFKILWWINWRHSTLLYSLKFSRSWPDNPIILLETRLALSRTSSFLLRSALEIMLYSEAF